MDSRIGAACSFILQSPPGEINDVLNDVRNIISDDETLEEGVLPALKEYNLAQFTTVDVPGTEHQVRASLSIISEAARLPTSENGEERWLDPRSKTSFGFNHLTLEASDPQPFEPDADAEEFRYVSNNIFLTFDDETATRSSLEKASLTYLLAHFHDGVASVFSKQGAQNQYLLQIVANKYNPSNYWSGRWRSEYLVNLNENTVEGKILVNIHYYEQGNVQLSTNHTISITLPSAVVTSPPSSAALKILALIETEEGKYQTSLNDTYHEMSEKTFKGLRRALPMTRQKLDWDKVLGYKLGAELSSSKGAFSTS
ncbi:F-actin capping protein, alpha subunit [Dendrothele bispora CBS 962.96]|uniref:F-actin-capping protein subunit alpha n=1 Tax=Dendrothele bispora (strain CBS 962.96) TaxID=1314807 RepID=A0A4V4HI50_DENBC|nr:F-actin capping protein, alpha subunit [Dendrothele bispora CBS 962.96]